MINKVGRMVAIGILLLIGTAVWAEGQLEITAPGGGEIDLGRNIMKYHSSDSHLVEVHWGNSVLETKFLEYSRTQQILKCKGQVNVIQNGRNLTSEELTVDLRRDYFTASKAVFLKYDNSTTVTGNALEWDNQSDQVKISGQAVVTYNDWTLKGNRIEGRLGQGLITALGSVEASNKEYTIRGGKLIYDRSAGKISIQDNPVLIHGNNQMAASEIIYDLKTNKVSANGTVKTRSNDETK